MAIDYSFLPPMNIIEPGAPVSVAQRIWLEKRNLVDYQQFRIALDDAYKSPQKEPGPVDKLEHSEPVQMYKPEMGLPAGRTEIMLRDAGEEYIQNRRMQNAESEYLRDRYVGGIGMSFDEIS